MHQFYPTLKIAYSLEIYIIFNTLLSLNRIVLAQFPEKALKDRLAEAGFVQLFDQLLL
jgi:hypothetical protein